MPIWWNVSITLIFVGWMFAVLWIGWMIWKSQQTAPRTAQSVAETALKTAEAAKLSAETALKTAEIAHQTVEAMRKMANLSAAEASAEPPQPNP